MENLSLTCPIYMLAPLFMFSINDTLYIPASIENPDYSHREIVIVYNVIDNKIIYWHSMHPYASPWLPIHNSIARRHKIK